MMKELPCLVELEKNQLMPKEESGFARTTTTQVIDEFKIEQWLY